MRLIKILPVIFLILFTFGKSFAAAPDIQAGSTEFDILNGRYILRDNVRVGIDNHGFQATVNADKAVVYLSAQSCYALGNVDFNYGNIVFSCDRAFLQARDKSVEAVGAIKFQNKQRVTVTAESATFNWDDGIADFYGKVHVVAKNDVTFSGGVKLKNIYYAHARYNVFENKFLKLDKKYNAPNIVVNDPVS